MSDKPKKPVASNYAGLGMGDKTKEFEQMMRVDPKMLARKLRKIKEDFNELAEDAARLGLKIEVGVKETSFKTCGDETIREPVAVLRCNLWEKVDNS